MSADQERRDAQLFEILGPYLAAFEAGRAPDREEFLARHPDHREPLEACLASLDALHVAGGRGPASLTGETLGDFEVGEEIGRGGMGVVYEARQVSLDRRVALKVLLTPALLDPARLRRFQTEALAAAHLQHPHIVPVHAVSCEDGIHFYAMQRVEGMTVAQVIGALRGGVEAPLPAPVKALVGDGSVTDRSYVRACARLARDAAEALEHAHRRGVVHRDVKPANLILDERGHVFVADFGLASFRTRGPGVTLRGDLVGTLRYMSPEQARAAHEAVDHRTDIYSLGVTLYEMLTLERAFPGESAPELIEAITKRPPPPLRRKNRHVPAALETIVETAMAKEPDDRYATASDLARDLDRFLGDRPVLARPVALHRRTGRFLARRRRMTVALLAVVVAAAAIFGVGKLRGRTTAATGELRGLRSTAGRRMDAAFVSLERGEEEEACARFREAAEIYRKVRRRDAGRPDDERRYAACLTGEARALINLERPADALPLLDEVIPTCLALTEVRPDWAIWAGLSRAHQLRAQALWELGRPGAEASFQHALGTLDRCPLPSHVGPDRHGKRTVFAYQYGLFLLERGRIEEATERFRKAVEGPVRNFEERAYLAWILATVPEATLRDPAKAVEFAQRALRVERSNGTFVLILGAALLRAGRFDEARETLGQAWRRRCDQCGCGIDTYLLAIACAKAGRLDEARGWFERTERRGPFRGRTVCFSLSEIRALRAEAASLLGL